MEDRVQHAETDVLIVGGGVAGLTAASLCGLYGVDALLVSALPTTSGLPKAHVLNSRTLEVFDQIGVLGEVQRRSTPPDGLRYVAWFAGVSGPHEDWGREISRQEFWGCGYSDPDYVNSSRFPTANLPQVHLEPILKARAETFGAGRVRFGHELVSLEQHPDHVVSTVRVRETGDQYAVRSRFVIAADGGRTVGPALGIDMLGERNLGNMVTVWFAADMTRVFPDGVGLGDPSVLLRWTINPDYGGSFYGGGIIPMGPTRWGADSEEWVMYLSYLPDDPDRLDEHRVLQRVRDSLGLPGFDPEIRKIAHWNWEHLVAERVQDGRVFLVGDSAHRHPPMGGLGLNAAVGDVANLCWKLRLVLDGAAGPALLDTYAAERLPVGAYYAKRSIENLRNYARLDAVLGVSPEKSAEENWAAVRRLWDDDPVHDDFRHEVRQVFASQSMEYREHNVHEGIRYASAAILPDDIGAPAGNPDPVRLYIPSTVPGTHLPHAFVERGRQRLAIDQLVRAGRFLLIAGEDGQAWVDAARRAAGELGVPVDAVSIGHLNGEWLDPRLSWTRQRQVGPAGCVLARPDRYTAWRSAGPADDPFGTLAAVFARLLDQDRPGWKES